MRVELPAPFSPTSACTSPSPSVNETSSRARTPGNCLLTPATSSNDTIPSEVGPLARRGPRKPGLVGETEVRGGVRRVVLPVGDDDVLRDRVAVEELGGGGE